jgi:hypothetical protein|tara:strand:- start:19747 stop:20970 length:1224 start_codon:yes stop_codon:yes gene_type:complete
MKYLFHLNTFNDIDHITPVIWKVLERGDFVDVIFLSNYQFDKDYRIAFLKEYSNFSVCRATILQRVRNKLLFNSKVRNFTYFNRYFNNLLSLISMHIWKNTYLKQGNVHAVVYEWGAPFRLNHYEAIQRMIPSIVLPHGYNIYLNYELNQHIKNIIKSTGKFPDHSSRNNFSTYVVQTKRHMNWSVDWGHEKDKLEVWGSARFCPEWSKKNLELCKTMKNSIPSHLTKVVFFLPHWRYNVKIDDVMKLLNKIQLLDSIYLFIKGHTRGGGSINKDNKHKLSHSKNIVINAPEHSPQLIDFCDIVINFGSSIAIDALNIGTPIIHTPYLHTNKTIFDTGMVNYIANSDEEVITLLTNKKLILPSKQSIENFFSEEVFAGNRNNDILNIYCQNILNISKQSFSKQNISR